MHATLTIARRELAAYFGTPLAYVFIVIFLALSGGLTFYIGAWLERGRADLQAFFDWHPWLYLFLVPAVGMRLWAEGYRGGGSPSWWDPWGRGRQPWSGASSRLRWPGPMASRASMHHAHSTRPTGPSSTARTSG